MKNNYKIETNPKIVFCKYVEEILLDLFQNHLLHDEINKISYISKYDDGYLVRLFYNLRIKNIFRQIRI
jgi:hypothetical protein